MTERGDHHYIRLIEFRVSWRCQASAFEEALRGEPKVGVPGHQKTCSDGGMCDLARHPLPFGQKHADVIKTDRGIPTLTP